jgi:hypothetical protein
MMEEDRRLRASLLGACWENLHDGAVGWLCPLAPGCGRQRTGTSSGRRGRNWRRKPASRASRRNIFTVSSENSSRSLPTRSSFFRMS